MMRFRCTPFNSRDFIIKFWIFSGGSMLVGKIRKCNTQILIGVRLKRWFMDDEKNTMAICILPLPWDVIRILLRGSSGFGILPPLSRILIQQSSSQTGSHPDPPPFHEERRVMLANLNKDLGFLHCTHVKMKMI
jgi:hypothetical protein